MGTRNYTFLSFAFALALLTGCDAKVQTFAPTQVMVRLEASNEVLAALDSLRVRIAASDDGKKWQKRGEAKYAAKSLKWPVDIPVTPSSESDPIKLFEVVAEALGEDGEPIVQARAITGFVKGEQRLLVMRLEACGAGQRGLGFICEQSDGCYGTDCERCVMGECRETEVTDPAKLGPLTSDTPSGAMDAAVPLDSATADAGSTCATGLQGKNCDEDVDECLTLCTLGSCENTMGSFICTCPPPGLVLNPGATDCDDVDECSDPSLCGQSTGMGVCTNTFGAHECACKLGQTGSLCEVVEQCLTNNVCNADYPCVEESAPLTYRCAGQFPEWQNINALGPYVVSDDTTTDTKTGLVWQRVLDPTERTWDAAKTYCSSLTLAGGNWRMPTITELRSIIDRSRWGSAIDPVGFEGSSSCWASSPYLGEGGGAWTVDFYSGFSSGSAVDRKNVAVRCVR